MTYAGSSKQYQLLMKNNRQQMTMSSYLYCKSTATNKDKFLKLTPIKELTQKQTLLLPSQRNKSPSIPYSPHKLSSAITARLRSNNQNSTKFRTSFIVVKSNSKIKKIKPIYINSELLLNRIEKTNQQKISNLLTQRKRKSYSECTISVAYQNSLPTSSFKRPSQATRQILQITKIRELFNNMEDQNDQKIKVVEKQSNLVILPQKLTLKKGERYTRSVCKTEADEQRPRQHVFKKHECFLRKEKIKKLKIIPIKLTDPKTVRDEAKQTFYEFSGWNIPKNQTLKSEQDELLYESSNSKKTVTEQRTKTTHDYRQEQEFLKPISVKASDSESGDNTFFVTRTNTNIE